MINVEKLMSIDRNDLSEANNFIETSDLPQLVEWLLEKDDHIRYIALLLLQNRSKSTADVYPLWDVFEGKLTSANSYQRSIGLMLIAENAKWDTENRIDMAIDKYLTLLNDEKPITVRQCIQALSKIIPAKPHLSLKIAEKLMAVNLDSVKETMRKPTCMDILTILALIEKQQPATEIRNYITEALSGDILDKKSQKQIEAVLQSAI